VSQLKIVTVDGDFVAFFNQGKDMNSRYLKLTVCVATLATVAAWPVCAQGLKLADSPAVSTANIGINVLKGDWVRPDGDYTIAIKGVGADGQLEAMYFNPNPLPFSRAQAVQKGKVLRVSLELRAGGYGGSTYELTYDPAVDRLTGVYYQAVAKQSYEIHFVRN